MVLFKKTLTKPETESLFPQQPKAASAKVSVHEPMSDVVARSLINSPEFIEQVSEVLTRKVLAILCEKYDFTPTDKYLEEVSNRRKYIGQLDSYLQQRREINNTVENELQMFLQETSSSLAKALDNFTISIQNRIKQAEARHGIDDIKKSLLSTTDNENNVNKTQYI
ncbi:MAG: hypothetical protein K0R14_1227 [Burkholderiales bacterium]|jgi:hypothetical protein|nr:hypothetical protein [Burkholderiales bacterium]